MDALLLEANHDVNMLQVGPYPYYLKKRILGDRGHLSNENSGRLLCRILHDGLKTVFLGHLSKENNLPELAFESVRMEINMGDNPYKAGDFDIRVARRSEVTEPRSVKGMEKSMKKTIITVVGKDTVGIIARVCTYLAENGINILDISQTIVQGYFNMMMIVDTGGCARQFGDMADDLAALGEEIGVVIKCQKEEIFDQMHRI